MSETGPFLSLAQLKPGMTELDADQELEYRTRTGVPIQLVDLRIVDEQMHDVPRDGKASGEVVVRAPWLTQGYLHTDDIGTIDPEGYLLITDRIKDVVKSGCKGFSSLRFQDIISLHSGVREVAMPWR